MDTINYDANGNEIERIIYDDYGYLVGKEADVRDAKGLLMESVLSDPKGAVMERRAYAYSNGKLTQVVSYDGAGKLVLKQVAADAAGGRVQEESYFDPVRLIGKTVYQYDRSGKITEVSFYRASGAKAVAPIGPCLGAHRVTNVYDAQGRLSKVVAFEPDGKVKKSWQYTYGPKGEIVEDIREDDWSTERFTHAYEYDSHDNWVKQISNLHSNSKLGSPPYSSKTEILREIKYY